ncbi:MAG: uroporphyrinogen decarboxylase/cobalamine-independent methonine synthase family protein [Planctomycetota bacterium]|jgi:hypothetical protein
MVDTSIKSRFLATGIGSMPFEDPWHAVEISLLKFREAPNWPQLPRLGFNEQMNVQYTENIPSVVIDRRENRVYFDTAADYTESFAEFYESYLRAMDPETGDGDCSTMAISSEFSKGIYALEEQLESRGERLPFVKVQTTGPCSFMLAVVDEKGQSIYYNKEFRDVVVKALAMKSRWQIHKFKRFADKVICFIDEPVLSAYGSSTYVSILRRDIVALLGETIEAIHADDGIAGVHCCGNTEWSMLIDAGVDVVSFDAFDFGETISMYPDAVKALLQGGGMLAWGIVPTSTVIREQSVATLAVHLEKIIDLLASKGIDKQLIIEQALITPACGTGTMEPADAEKVFDITCGLSEAMREKYGLELNRPGLS